MRDTKKPAGQMAAPSEEREPVDRELPLGPSGEQDPGFGLPNFFLSTKKTRGARSSKVGRFQKSNALVHNNPQVAMSVMQQKMTNILLRNAQHNASIAESTVRWKISISEITGQLGITTRNLAHIEKIINQMMSIKVRWNVMDEKGVAKNYAVVFPYAKLEQGEMTYEIQIEVIKLLQEFQSYTSLNLKEISKLSKKSAIPLYELASRYLNIGYSRWFEWEKLRDMLVAADNIPNNAKTWVLFNTRYLKPAIEDVNAQTDILVSVENQIYKKKITHVRILVTKNMNSLDNVAKRASSPDKVELYTELRNLGCREKSADIFMAQYSKDELKLAINFTRQRNEATNLKPLLHPEKYLANALKTKIYLEPASFTTGKSLDLFKIPISSSSELSTPQSQALGKQHLTQVVEMERKNNVKIILAEINKSELLDLYEEFNAGLKTKSLWISDGRNKPGVVAAFQDWYAKRLYGEITDKEIVETLARNFQQK